MQKGATPRERVLLAVLAVLALLGAPGAAAGEEPKLPVVPLDQLLRLPDSAPVSASIEKRGGSTKAEWQARFRTARADLAEAEAVLAATRKELEELAGESGSQWTMSAPGLGGGGGAQAATDSPLDYRLSQDLRRQREEVERTKKALHDLETEANLAGVPEAWRQPQEAAAEPRSGG